LSFFDFIMRVDGRKPASHHIRGAAMADVKYPFCDGTAETAMGGVIADYHAL